MSQITLDSLDKSTWKSYTFQTIAHNRSERIDPTNTDLEIYIGLSHIDSESLHIMRRGKREDVNGQKLRCRPGDIIFGRRRAYQRKAAIVDFEGFCSAHSLVLYANEEIIDPQLFPFFLHSDAFMNRAMDISVGSLSPTINWGTLKHQKFLLPPKKQQAKIAELLWAADEAVKSNLLAYDNLKQLHNVFVEKCLIQRAGTLTSLPSLGAIVRGVGYKPKQLLQKISSDSVILLRSNNIKDGEINYDVVKVVPRSLVKDEQLLRVNDFAVCMSNGSKELVGKTARFNGAPYDVCVGSFCSVFRPDSKESSVLAEQLFHSVSYRARVKQILTGTNINNLKPSDFELFRFRIEPNSNLLRNTIRNCDESLSLTDSVKKHTDEAKQLLKSLINQIF